MKNEVYIDEIGPTVMTVYLPPMIHGSYVAVVANELKTLPFVTETDWVGLPTKSVITVHGDDFYEHNAGAVYDKAVRVWEDSGLSHFVYRNDEP